MADAEFSENNEAIDDENRTQSGLGINNKAPMALPPPPPMTSPPKPIGDKNELGLIGLASLHALIPIVLVPRKDQDCVASLEMHLVQLEMSQFATVDRRQNCNDSMLEKAMPLKCSHPPKRRKIKIKHDKY